MASLAVFIEDLFTLENVNTHQLRNSIWRATGHAIRSHVSAIDAVLKKADDPTECFMAVALIRELAGHLVLGNRPRIYAMDKLYHSFVYSHAAGCDARLAARAAGRTIYTMIDVARCTMDEDPDVWWKYFKDVQATVYYYRLFDQTLSDHTKRLFIKHAGVDLTIRQYEDIPCA